MEVQRARALIRHKGLPKNESGYKQLIKTLITKGLQLPEISRAICLEKYKINNSEQFPKAKVNKVKKTYSTKSVLNKSIKTKNHKVIESKSKSISKSSHNIHQTNHEHIQNDNISNKYASPTMASMTMATQSTVVPLMDIGQSQTTQKLAQNGSSLPPFLTKSFVQGFII